MMTEHCQTNTTGGTTDEQRKRRPKNTGKKDNGRKKCDNRLQSSEQFREDGNDSVRQIGL